MNQENQLPRDADGLVGLEAWSRSFDRLYRKTDRLYYDMAHTCGLSESAYWVMYAIYVSGGTATVRSLVEECVASKQTINSALRSLEAKGLVEMSFCEGSKKSKFVALTEAGTAFADRRIAPACAAERRAFDVLDADEQAELIRLVEKYVEGVEAELARSKGADDER